MLIQTTVIYFSVAQTAKMFVQKFVYSYIYHQSTGEGNEENLKLNSFEGYQPFLIALIVDDTIIFHVSV